MKKNYVGLSQAVLERELIKHRRILKTLGNITAVNRAIASGLNKTAALAKTETIKGVSSSTGIKQKLIRPKVKIDKATAKKLKGGLWSNTKGIPLIKLNAKEVPGGVQAGAYLVPDGFIAAPTRTPRQHRRGRRNPSDGLIKGGPQVFARKGRGAYPLENQKVSIEKDVRSKGNQAARRAMRNHVRRLILHEYTHRITRMADRYK